MTLDSKGVRGKELAKQLVTLVLDEDWGSCAVLVNKHRSMLDVMVMSLAGTLATLITKEEWQSRLLEIAVREFNGEQ